MSDEAKKTVDKRRATWRLVEVHRDRIAECFTSQTVLLATLQKNTKTGPKIMKCQLVKKDHLKTFVTDYLNFLRDWHNKKIMPNGDRFYEDDVLACIAIYCPNGQKIDWLELCVEEPDAPKQIS